MVRVSRVLYAVSIGAAIGIALAVVLEVLTKPQFPLLG
jgi:hypothetical protein